MTSIFDPRKPIDDSNFLEYDISRLKTANSAAAYREGLGNLVGIRDVLKVLGTLGRLQEVGNRNYYIEALRWLKGETSLSNWHHVPQLPELGVMTIEVAEAFRLYTEQLRMALRAEPLYSQVETAMKVAPIIKATPINKRVEQALASAQDKLNETASEKLSLIQALGGDVDTQVRSAIESARSAADSNLQNRVEGAYSQINQYVQNAVSQIQQATVLRDWGVGYDQDIAELTRKLYGKTLNGTLLRNVSSLRSKSRSLLELGVKKINWPRLILKTLFVIVKNSWSLMAIIASKLFSIAGRRSISFLLLASGALSMVALPVLEVSNVIHLHLFNPDQPAQWLVKITIFLPLVIILSIAYSFATKNYRIYANMLDQYKHRRAVARTAQGIILNVDGESVRDAMTAAAATALFDHKVTGHLSKKEVETLGFFDMLKSMGSK